MQISCLKQYMQIFPARFISLAKNSFCYSAKGNMLWEKQHHVLFQISRCGFFITTIEVCFESSRKESDGKTVQYLFAEKALFSSALINSYQHASEMVVSERSLGEFLNLLITVHVPETFKSQDSFQKHTEMLSGKVHCIILNLLIFFISL